MRMSYLDTPVEFLKGVGPQRADMLKKELGIHTFADLLHYYPFRYSDRSRFHQISELAADMPYVQVRGRISDIQLFGERRTTRMTAVVRDGTGYLELVWFRGFTWIKNRIKPGVDYVVFGKPVVFGKRLSLPHPEIEEVSKESLSQAARMQAVYNTTEKLKSKGLDSKGLGRLIKNLLPLVWPHIEETLPRRLLENLRLPARKETLREVHFPSDQACMELAVRRLKFEELFYIQLNLFRHKIMRMEKSSGYVFPDIGDYFNRFYHQRLTFSLTEAQKRVIREIRSDTLSGRQMNRLLQGDVGSGKTVVAIMSMLMALDNGFQACLMAPTEVLAFQHFESVSKLLDPLGVRCGLLTGSTRMARRKEILKGLKEGSMHIVIGTHALIEDVVGFERLGLAVVDEQHRFGVAQRARLWSKSKTPPHVLVMTATPIPRTLAMTLYGDLEVSVIDELPPGRKPIKTFHQTDANRLRVFGFMREQIQLGRQVFVVYPLIQESEALDLKDLTDGYESIVRAFPLPDYGVSIVHGRMKPAEKDYEMQRFVSRQTQIMVATTVIEVGIDVPNASVMVIESAERFGLSQLHQLRGRVGRGADQSYCILMTGTQLSQDARKRMQVMVGTNNGFEIAEVDLQLRGPGDIQGTRQSGVLDLKIADLVTDEPILARAREEARALLDQDAGLIAPENKMVARQLKHLYPDKLFWSRIS